MFKTLSGPLTALLLSLPAGDPQERHRPAPDPVLALSFKSLDRDHDGKVSREEFGEAFAMLDRNHDNLLTPEELSGGKTPGPKKGKPAPAKGKRKH